MSGAPWFYKTLYKILPYRQERDPFLASHLFSAPVHACSDALQAPSYPCHSQNTDSSSSRVSENMPPAYSFFRTNKFHFFIIFLDSQITFKQIFLSFLSNKSTLLQESYFGKLNFLSIIQHHAFYFGCYL